MEPEKKSLSRKRFIVWGVGLVSFFSILGVRFSGRKQKQTVKMLGKDGKLVEIDASAIKGKPRKISDAELQAWVNK